MEKRWHAPPRCIGVNAGEGSCELRYNNIIHMNAHACAGKGNKACSATSKGSRSSNSSGYRSTINVWELGEFVENARPRILWKSGCIIFSEWCCIFVLSWLVHLNFICLQKLESAGFTLDTLKMVDDAGLRKAGIVVKGQRDKILEAVKNL